MSEKAPTEKNRFEEPVSEKASEKRSHQMNSKRIVALLGVILLAALPVITLIVALVDKDATGKWFMLCLIGCLTIPLLVWIYTWMYGMLTQKRTIASFEVGVDAKTLEQAQDPSEPQEATDDSPAGPN